MKDFIEIVMAGFRIDKRNSAFYKRFKTKKGFLNALDIALELNPDYISIRIIRDYMKEGPE